MKSLQNSASITSKINDGGFCLQGIAAIVNANRAQIRSPKIASSPAQTSDSKSRRETRSIRDEIVSKMASWPRFYLRSLAIASCYETLYNDRKQLCSQESLFNGRVRKSIIRYFVREMIAAAACKFSILMCCKCLIYLSRSIFTVYTIILIRVL